MYYIVSMADGAVQVRLGGLCADCIGLQEHERHPMYLLLTSDHHTVDVPVRRLIRTMRDVLHGQADSMGMFFSGS